jgi:hypothetical protein
MCLAHTISFDGKEFLSALPIRDIAMVFAQDTTHALRQVLRTKQLSIAQD